MLTTLARARQARRETKEQVMKAIQEPPITPIDRLIAMSIVTYRELELGHVKASAPLRAALAEYFGIPEEELFDQYGYAIEPGAVNV